MKKAFFGSPLMARVGQRFSQAVQPVQFSATIVKGIGCRPREVSGYDERRGVGRRYFCISFRISSVRPCSIS